MHVTFTVIRIIIEKIYRIDDTKYKVLTIQIT